MSVARTLVFAGCVISLAGFAVASDAATKTGSAPLPRQAPTHSRDAGGTALPSAALLKNKRLRVAGGDENKEPVPDPGGGKGGGDGSGDK